MNRFNKSKHSSNYKGVSFHSRDRIWESHITVNKKQYYVGRFNSEIEAAHARDLKAIELHGEYANLNFK